MRSHLTVFLLVSGHGSLDAVIPHMSGSDLPSVETSCSTSGHGKARLHVPSTKGWPDRVDPPLPVIYQSRERS
jgi:hypothetical protein